LAKKPKKEPRHTKPAPTLMKGTLHVFTDGSCCRRTRQGGWGLILKWGEHEQHVYGGSAEQTNNKMELQAILEALQARKRDVRTMIYSDSQYSINAVTTWHHGWRRRGWLTAAGAPVKNVELIEAITALITPSVAFQWVRGHNGHYYNEIADRLALKGRKEFGTCQKPQKSLVTISEANPATTSQEP
jgi:ribonuclease HI